MTDGRAWYRLWDVRDSLIPGITYAIAFSAGSLIGHASLGLATTLLGLFLLFAIGANVGAALERRMCEVSDDGD